MKTFFIKTRIFWIITRILLIALYIASALSPTSPNVAISILFISVSVLMVFVAVREFLKKPKIIVGKIIIGGFSILIGATIAGLTLYMGTSNYVTIFMGLLPTWYILYGRWEIYATKEN